MLTFTFLLIKQDLKINIFAQFYIIRWRQKANSSTTWLKRWDIPSTVASTLQISENPQAWSTHPPCCHLLQHFLPASPNPSHKTLSASKTPTNLSRTTPLLHSLYSQLILSRHQNPLSPYTSCENGESPGDSHKLFQLKTWPSPS